MMATTMVSALPETVFSGTSWLGLAHGQPRLPAEGRDLEPVGEVGVSHRS